jgi:hypothetical protein
VGNGRHTARKWRDGNDLGWDVTSRCLSRLRETMLSARTLCLVRARFVDRDKAPVTKESRITTITEQ